MAESDLSKYVTKFLASFIKAESGCWEWTRGKIGDGYGQIWDGKRNGLAHRFSWLTYRGEIPLGMMVLHHCDNRRCVNPDHLFLGTNADNVSDKVSKNRQQRLNGRKNGRCILSEDQVKQILATSGKDRNDRELSIRFGVSRKYISGLRSGQNWAWLRKATSAQSQALQGPGSAADSAVARELGPPQEVETRSCLATDAPRNETDKP